VEGDFGEFVTWAPGQAPKLSQSGYTAYASKFNSKVRKTVSGQREIRAHIFQRSPRMEASQLKAPPRNGVGGPAASEARMSSGACPWHLPLAPAPGTCHLVSGWQICHRRRKAGGRGSGNHFPTRSARGKNWPTFALAHNFTDQPNSPRRRISLT
jgi:hypothetical protein